MANVAGCMFEPGTSKKKKTGAWRAFKPKVTDKCTGCGICISYCPDRVITIKNSGGKKRVEIDYDYCKGCLICVEICPQKAIEKEREK